MLFSSRAKDLLENMRINVDNYEDNLTSSYKEKASLFSELLDYFAKHSSSELTCAEFNMFINSVSLVARDEECKRPVITSCQ